MMFAAETLSYRKAIELPDLSCSTAASLTLSAISACAGFLCTFR